MPMLRLIILLLLAALPARANPALCEAAAQRAAAESGVPMDVLLAIALTETGRAQGGRLRPWPWAANAEGEGHWFATRAEAATFAHRLLARGQTSFDLGCFQINWRWHGQHFTRPEDLLDPVTAARYAARFLADLRAETGSWEGAAGAYHSRAPDHAARYRTRFAQIRATLQAPPTDAPVAPDNPFPLLTGAPALRAASLVPATLPSRRPLF